MSYTKKQISTLKRGAYFVPEGEKEPFMVLGSEHAKSGKHGHAKNRIECIGLFTKKKKSISFPADEMMDVPEILKKTGQMVDLDAKNKIAHVMDLEDNSMYDVDYPMDEDEVDVFTKLATLEADPDLQSEATVEYWDVMNKKFITRVMINK